MDVELRHLRCLVAVGRELSFTDAAIALGLSQAAVSRTVQQLERRVGVALVVRTSRRVELTAAGTALAASAARLLDEVESAVDAARGVAPALRVGYSWAGLGAVGEAVRRDWAARHPGGRLRFVRAADPAAWLRERRGELVVLRGTRVPEGVEAVPVGRERRLCAVPADEALQGPVTLAALASRVIAVDRRTGSTDEGLWLRAGLEPPRMVEVADVDEWFDLIASGAALGLTAEATAALNQRTDVRYLEVADAPAVPVALGWEAGRRPAAAEELVELARARYAAAERGLDPA